MTDMLTNMRQYNELVEEYKTKVLACARFVILLLGLLRHISRILKISRILNPSLSLSPPPPTHTHNFNHPFSFWSVLPSSGAFPLYKQNVVLRFFILNPILCIAQIVIQAPFNLSHT